MEYKTNRAVSAKAITNEFPMLANDVAHSNDGFWYQFYHRLASDCEYWMHYGNSVERQLWTHDRSEQIRLMDLVIDLLPVDWVDEGMLTDLEKYRQAMTA